MNSLLHESAMRKLGTVKMESLVKGIFALAQMAAKSNAATAEAKLSWLDEEEIVDAHYVPELILRVIKVVQVGSGVSETGIKELEP